MNKHKQLCYPAISKWLFIFLRVQKFQLEVKKNTKDEKHPKIFHKLPFPNNIQYPNTSKNCQPIKTINSINQETNQSTN